MYRPLFDKLCSYIDDGKDGVPGLLEMAYFETLRHDRVDRDQLLKLYQMIWPNGNYVRDVETLLRLGCLAEGYGFSYYIPAELKDAVGAALSKIADTCQLPFKPDMTLSDLKFKFIEYCQHEAGGLVCKTNKTGRVEITYQSKIHYLETRLLPCMSEPDQEGYHLIMGIWHPDVLTRLSPFILKETWFRRVAIYNLAASNKINIAPTGLFAYLDWYLRDNFGLRVVPCRRFTLGLIDMGLLRMEG